MAQLHQEYNEFVARDAEIVVVGPEDRSAFKTYWEKERLPFVGLADPQNSVADRYGQEVNLLRMGRMPALVVVGKDGVVYYQHYGDTMRDIPPNSETFAVLENLNRKSERDN